MKKIISAALIGIMTVSLTACSSGTSNIIASGLIKAAEYPKSISYEDYEAKNKQMTDNEVHEAFAKALEEFASNSTAILLGGSDENVVYSPISLYMALSVLASGADGNTKEEIYKTMGLSGKDIDYLTEQTGKLYRRLYSENEVGTLKIANALWLENKFPFHDDYVTKAAEKFYASIYNVDYKDEKTPELMKKWVSDNTNGLIEPDIQLSDDQVLTIMNTVYFKDRFRDVFNKELTQEDTFYLKDGSTTTVEFMNKTESAHSYVKTDEYISTNLPLLNNGTITFILPEEGIDVNELISDSEKVAQMFKNENSSLADITFKVPKFNYGSNLDLVEMLNSLGMKDAFEESANFSQISEKSLFVSGIKQDTHIILDEEGVEAAAYTEISMEPTSMSPQNLEEIDFHLDRPFIYGITANDGTLLFVGVCNNPSSGK